ncbi:MAG TPA: DUF3052 domain-containing protein [Xanthomonadales bacterium]|nr:DUF3052 domain-containing protein [Xanthomonadales bacterium]
MKKPVHTVGQTVSKPGQTKNTAGYSATPLSKKLGIKPGQEIWLINAPEEYLEWLQPLPDGVVFKKRQSRNTGLVHLFMTRQVALQKKLQQIRQSLEPQIPVWVSWPKKSSGVTSTITEDTIRQAALPLGYVDIKVCAVSAVWSGLKLVVRKELR